MVWGLLFSRDIYHLSDTVIPAFFSSRLLEIPPEAGGYNLDFTRRPTACPSRSCIPFHLENPRPALAGLPFRYAPRDQVSKNKEGWPAG